MSEAHVKAVYDEVADDYADRFPPNPTRAADRAGNGHALRLPPFEDEQGCPGRWLRRRALPVLADAACRVVGVDTVAEQPWDVVIDVSRQPGQVRSAVTALAGRSQFYVFVSSANVYADHSRPDQNESTPVLPALDEDVMETMATYGEAKAAGSAERALRGPPRQPEAMDLYFDNIRAGPTSHCDQRGRHAVTDRVPAIRDRDDSHGTSGAGFPFTAMSQPWRGKQPGDQQ